MELVYYDNSYYFTMSNMPPASGWMLEIIDFVIKYIMKVVLWHAKEVVPPSSEYA